VLSGGPVRLGERELRAVPLAILLPLLFGIWYLVSAKDRYEGPVRTAQEDEVTAVNDLGGLQAARRRDRSDCAA
jgi:hypothetical protein